MTKHTCNWVDLSGFKIIITINFIEDMKIAQEKLKLQVRFNEA